MIRQSWDEYFLDICDVIATRATCDRLKVGAVLVKDKHIISTGYNGSLSGEPHCDEIGHDIVDNHCIRVVHSEVNAIAQAAKLGISTQGTTLYCNYLPCYNCLKTIISAGVINVYYRHSYRPDPRCLANPIVKTPPTVDNYD